MSPAGFEGFDRIMLSGLRARGFHGVLPSERENGQEFVVDVVLHAEIRQAGHTDALTDTIDYAAVAEAVHDVITGPACNLIEAVAQRIAAAVFEVGDDRSVPLSMVEVTVHKPHAPIDVAFADVAVSIVRVR